MAIETTGNGEFNARDARRIASRSENPYISRFEKEIKQAAEDGDRGVLLCYTDCCSNAHAALAVVVRITGFLAKYAKPSLLTNQSDSCFANLGEGLFCR